MSDEEEERAEVPQQKVDDEAARARSLALLEATHKFPCDYHVTVVAFNREAVTEAVRRAARPAVPEGDGHAEGDGEGFSAYEARASREGKYLSHRFAVRVVHSGEVLELYARLRSLEGVLTIL